MVPRGRLFSVVVGVCLVTNACGPEGGAPVVPVGGSQVFAGAMSDGSTFKGRAWLDSRTGKRQLCAEVGQARCQASYSTSAALGHHRFAFSCDDGRKGTAKSFRKTVQGKSYSYSAHIQMKDGAYGLASLSPPQNWYGEELCTPEE